MSEMSDTPKPPYYAVIFTSVRTEGGSNDKEGGYDAMAERMAELAKTMPGYLGRESVRDASGLGITVSYWESEEAISRWKKNAEHQEAQKRGRAEWYSGFRLRVAKVERAYGM